MGGRRRKEGAWAEPRARLARDPRGAPLSALSRLAAASPPPAPGAGAGASAALPGGRPSRARPSSTSPPIPARPHTVAGRPHGSRLILRGPFPCSATPPTPRSGQSGRRLPGGALPGTRAGPKPNPHPPPRGAAGGGNASRRQPPRRAGGPAPRPGSQAAGRARRPCPASSAPSAARRPCLARRFLSSPSRGEPPFTAGWWERRRAEKRDGRKKAGFFRAGAGLSPLRRCTLGAPR